MKIWMAPMQRASFVGILFSSSSSESDSWPSASAGAGSSSATGSPARCDSSNAETSRLERRTVANDMAATLFCPPRAPPATCFGTDSLPCNRSERHAPARYVQHLVRKKKKAIYKNGLGMHMCAPLGSAVWLAHLGIMLTG